MFALSNIRVIECGGLVPVPFCGMMLADFGASVLRIQSKNEYVPNELLNENKTTLSLDLKDDKDKRLFSKLVNSSDVLLDSYRPGILEKLGFSPDNLHKMNPKLVIARLSGYGQPQEGDSGAMKKYRKSAGHDINYLAMSGILNCFGNDKMNVPPTTPINLLGDFAGGASLCAWGVVLALFERTKSGKGSIVDSSMTHGTNYLSTFIYRSMKYYPVIWPNANQRGGNILDGGAPFYRTYQTKDDKWVAVGALEPKFYINFLQVIGIPIKEAPQDKLSKWPQLIERIQSVFRTKTREEWMNIIEECEKENPTFDSCISPVLNWQETDQFWQSTSIGLGPQPIITQQQDNQSKKTQETDSVFNWSDFSEDEIKHIKRALL